MKVLKSRTEGCTCSDILMASLIRELERLVCEFDDLVPAGWRCILEVQRAGSDVPLYELDVQSNRGGGTWAEAKMATLKKFPAMAATTKLEIDAVLSALDQLGYGGDCPTVKQIRNLEDVGQLTTAMWQWLLDTVQFTPCYGAVRVPFQGIYFEDGRASSEAGEVRIVFSGATGEQDVFFCISLLKVLIDGTNRVFRETQIWYNLQELARIPVVNFELKRVKIREA